MGRKGDEGGAELARETPLGVLLAATGVFHEGGSVAVCDAACGLVARHGAALRFLYVLPPVRFPSAGTEGIAQREALRQATWRLDRLVERAREQGVEATWRTRVGKTQEAIREEVQDSGADLVVVSTPKRWFPGRWLRRLRRLIGVSVLCVPRAQGRAQSRDLGRVNTILAAASRREAALSAAGAALRLLSPSAPKTGLATHLHLLRPRPQDPAPGGVGEADANLRRGDPAESVVQQARATDADLVAFASREQRRSRIFSWLRRSLLGRLLTRLSRPLLLP